LLETPSFESQNENEDLEHVDLPLLKRQDTPLPSLDTANGNLEEIGVDNTDLEEVIETEQLIA
jgi:hypothetical protein